MQAHFQGVSSSLELFLMDLMQSDTWCCGRVWRRCHFKRQKKAKRRKWIGNWLLMENRNTCEIIFTIELRKYTAYILKNSWNMRLHTLLTPAWHHQARGSYWSIPRRCYNALEWWTAWVSTSDPYSSTHVTLYLIPKHITKTVDGQSATIETADQRIIIVFTIQQVKKKWLTPRFDRFSLVGWVWEKLFWPMFHIFLVGGLYQAGEAIV